MTTVGTAWTAAAVDETIRPDDAAAIRACILDYFEGWFEGDVERMDRALHPGLAKYAVGQGPSRADDLDVTTKADMLEATGRGVGRTRDVPDRAIRIDIVAVSDNIASAIAHTAVYVEFVLLARTRDGWQLTGVLWRWATGHGPRA
jgi:Putative lumazine-binding